MTPDPGRPRSGPVTLVDQRVHIAASPARVYTLLTDATRFIQWMAPEATIDAHPGGTITWRHQNGDRCGGTFLELVPDRRIVFTYGWERKDVGIPVGSTTVEITLHPTTGGTELHLVHRGLSAPMSQAHAGGWRNYLRRLTDVAEHRDPGPDALARQRVPAAHDQQPS
jgi:uncharacterized protein YndB with AHSA1/START domain